MVSHHHHHSGGPLAAKARSGRTLAVSPRLVQEGLSINVVPVGSLHGGGAASISTIHMCFWDRHEIDRAASV